MADIAEPRVYKPAAKKPRRKVSPLDIIFMVVVVAIIGFLAVMLIQKLSLKHDVSGARAVSDKIVTDISTRNGSDAYKLGTERLRSKNNAAQLATQFKNISPLTKGNPTVDRQTLDAAKTGKTVFVIYKYPTKPAFYLLLAIEQHAGKWQLDTIMGNTDESQLVVD